MKNLIVIFVAIIGLAACKDKPNRVVSLEVSPNGHKFHFMPINERGVSDITVTIAWPTNWGYRGDANPAVPYVGADAILSGGTADLKPQEILGIFEDKNSYGFMYATVNHIVGEIEFPKEHVDQVISIASEMLQKPQFSEGWVDRTKQSLTAKQAEGQKQTVVKMWQTARRSILGDQPLYHSLSLSNLNDIERVQVNDLRDWHAETFVQTGATIVVTGAIDTADAGDVIDRLLSGLPKGKAIEEMKAQSNFSNKLVLLHLPEAEKTSLGFIGQLPATTEGKDGEDLLALHQFSKSGSGPLFDAVRTKLRASYGFSAGLSNYDRATRLMFIAGEVETSKLNEAKDLVLETYASYLEDPMMDGFEDLRKDISDRMANHVEGVNTSARTILQFALDGQNTNKAPTLGQVFAEITAQDVAQRMATAFPKADDLFIIAASPDANALDGACVITKIEQVADCP